MAYSDPQTVTVSTVAKTLPNTGRGLSSGTYDSVSDGLKLSVSHSTGKRFRRVARLDFKKIAPDPLLAVNTEFGMSAYLVVDVPKTGFTVAESKAIVDGLTKWLTDTTGANTTRLLNGES